MIATLARLIENSSRRVACLLILLSAFPLYASGEDFIDSIHAWHSMETDRLHPSEFTKSVHALHYYDSVLVIEKRPIEEPFHLQTGTPVIPEFHPRKTRANRLKKRLRDMFR
jgi:hypothetical protein